MTVTAELADGRRLEFPDGTDPGVVQATVKKMLGGNDKSVPGSEGAQDSSRNLGKPNEEGFLTKARGAVEAAGNFLVAPVTAAVGGAGAALGAMAGSVRQRQFGTPQAAQAVQQAANEGAAKLAPPAPQTETGQGIVEGVGKALSGLPPVPTQPALMARAAAPVIQQAVRVAGDVAGAVAAAPGKAVAALVPMPEARVAALAKKAVDLGIPLRPDQLSTNSVMRSVGEALEKVPLSGSKAKQRQIGFNRALGGLIGAEESDHLTPDVFSRAMEKSGGKIGEIAKETSIAVDSEIQQTFAARLEHVNKRETSDVARVVSGYIKDLADKTENGVIPGETFRKINSELGTQIRSAQGDLKRALSDLQEDMHDALVKNIKTPERLAELQEARKQYAIGKTIEPLVAKATTSGNISPGGLLGRVTANNAGKARMASGRGGELGDLAEIGKLFLKEPPSSGTAERAAAYGAIGGISAGAFLEPHTAAAATGAIAGANIYNRAGPAMVRRALRDVEAKKQEPRARREREKLKPAEEKQFMLKDALSEPVPAEEQTPLRSAVGQ